MSSDRKQKIEKSFGKRAQSYHQHAVLQRDIAKKLSDMLPDIKPVKIAEIGCGTGFLTEELLAKYPQVQLHATDLSTDMLHFTRQRFTGYKNLSCSVQDGETLNLAGQYDLIVTSMAVQWFDNPVAALEGYKNLLTPNGEIYFTTLGQESFKEWHNVLDDNGLLNTPAYKGIVKEEKNVVIYKDGLHFLKHLKEVGAHQAKEDYTPKSSTQIKQACRDLEEKFDTAVTWHILYGCLKKN